MSEAGVVYYESFVTNGHSEYVAKDGTALKSVGFYSKLTIASVFAADRVGNYMRQIQSVCMDHFDIMKAHDESVVKR